MLQFQAIHWQLENAGIDPSSMAFIFLQNVDVLFRGEGVPLPSTVILDYVYGYCHLQSLAKQERWFQPNGGIPQQILRTDSATSTRGIDETDVTPEPDNPNDSDYAPPEDIDDTDVTSGPNNLDYKPPRKHYAPTRRNGLEETMDEDELKIYIHGITPEMAAERRQKK